MLIESPRLTPTDRAEWDRRESYDRRLAAGLGGKPAAAIKCVEDWAARLPDGEPVTVAVSWGKDSVVVADLALRSAVASRVQLRWVRQRWYENPDCEPVRDAFTAAHPGAVVEERTVTTPWPRRWDMDGSETTTYKIAPRRGGVWPERRVTGIRAEESDTRRRSASTHGEATDLTCRPIIRWTTHDVFAYLAARGLPVHPAYAMTTFGGQDRNQIRVHSLGGLTGCWARGPWEDAYYGRVIREDRVAVACLRALPASKTGRLAAASVHSRVSDVVEACGLSEVSVALWRLNREGIVARMTHAGRERWWRWPDVRVAIPGKHMAGDLV